MPFRTYPNLHSIEDYIFRKKSQKSYQTMAFIKLRLPRIPLFINSLCVSMTLQQTLSVP